jgi:photosystem II stability/assembly factor-like uncharacterized protein
VFFIACLVAGFHEISNHFFIFLWDGSGTKLIAVSYNSITSDDGGIYVTTNSGSSWMQADAPRYNWTSVCSSSDGGKSVAVANAGAVFVSTNYGINWCQCDAPASNWISVVSSADGKKLTIVAGTINTFGPICTSSDSGTTWTLNELLVSNWLSAASSADGCKLFAGLSGGGIYASQTMPSPELQIASLSRQPVLFWTLPSKHFVLQESADLISWTDETNPPVLNPTNLQYQVMLNLPNCRGFFRLKTP